MTITIMMKPTGTMDGRCHQDGMTGETTTMGTTVIMILEAVALEIMIYD